LGEIVKRPQSPTQKTNRRENAFKGKKFDVGTGAQLLSEVSVDVEPSLEAVTATELTVSETVIGPSQQNEYRPAGRDLCTILASFVNRVFNIYWVVKTSNSSYSGRLSHRL
jgi:hypothetical protein